MISLFQALMICRSCASNHAGASRFPPRLGASDDDDGGRTGSFATDFSGSGVILK